MQAGEYKKENSYSNILKRISAFGGVQVFSILINLIRGKFVALLLGPDGMGISTLFTSATSTIQQFGSFGLNLAIVKEVAATKRDSRIADKVIAVSLRLILITSIIGAAICGLAAPLWSKLTFGSYDYTKAFVALAVSVALSIGGAGYLAILQGFGAVRRIAKASLVGGMSGLICGVPLYYLFGTGGIVPAIILLSISTFLFYFISFRCEYSLKANHKPIRWKEHKSLVKRLIGLGAILMAGSLVGTAVGYLINLFVRHFGSVGDVGLYQAANSLTSQYVGIIFSALAMDYFPRLSAIAADRQRLGEVVNRQTEIVMLVVTPLVLLLIITSPLVIRILLTKEFLVVTPLMRWMGLGMLIQAMAFPIGYIYLAKEDRKAYILMELMLSNTLWITASVLGYYFWGLVGLGISLVGRGCLDLIINLFFCYRRYGFGYVGKTGTVIIVSILLGSVGFCASFIEGITGYVVSGGILVVSVIYSSVNIRKGLKNNIANV